MNKLRFYIKWSVLLFSIMLGVFACSPGTSTAFPTIHKTQVETNIALPPSMTPSLIIHSTSTPLPSFTPSVVPSQTKTTKVDITSSCLKVMDHVPTQAKLTGQLVLKPRLESPFILDLFTGSKTLLSNKATQETGFDSFATSPDGKWLAYNTYPPNRAVFIQSFDGKQKKRIPEQWGRYITIVGWLDNQQLVLLHSNDPSPFLTTVILNPFTVNWNEYKLEDLNNYALSLGGTHLYFNSSNLMPDPSQNLVVYPQQYNLITLWNIKTRQVVTTLEDHGHFNHDPLWNIDGTDFVIVVSSGGGTQRKMDWFRVSNQGEVQQITNFKNSFDFASISSESRSPDGKQVAFWISTQPDLAVGEWAVMNLETPSQLRCIEGPPMIWSSPIWSPDSRYITVANLNGSRNGPVMILDTQERWAAKITQDAVPMGWLITP